MHVCILLLAISTHVYFAKNAAYFPFNSWFSFQRLCRLLWGLHCYQAALHARSAKMWPIVTVVAWSVSLCLSVHASRSLCLLDTIMIWGLQKQISRSSAVWDVDSGGPENHVHVLGGGRIPTERGNLGASPTVRLFVNTIRYDTKRWAILACAQKLT